MTAVVATLGRHIEQGREWISALLSPLRHRGDRDTVRASAGIALGVRYEGSERRCSWAGAVTWVACDARIDNRVELVQTLGLEPDAPNAEIIGRAYERWRERWPEHVRGDFAAVIWDVERASLSVARDPVGVKTLYWTAHDGGVSFGTEMRALARVARHATPNRLQCALYLVDGYDDRDDTLIERVNAVPPAHVLTWTGGAPTRHRYWLAPHRSQRFRSRDECAEAFLPILRRAVHDRMVGGELVASDVSGGLDSTSVTVVAAAHRPTLGVALTFPSLPCDESSYARAVAGHAGCELLEVDPLDDPALLVPSFAPHASGDVLYHPTLAFKWLQLRRTRARGIRVTLTGLGSDHLVRREEAGEAVDAFRRRDLRGIAASVRTPRAALRSVADWVLGPRRRRALARRLRRRSLLAAELARQVDEVLATRLERLRPGRDETQVLVLRALEHDLGVPLASLDGMAARERSEFRHPFLDRAVIEFLASAPHALLAGQGSEFRKPMLRVAMERTGLLPPLVLERRSVTEFNPFVRRVVFECGTDPRQLVEHGLVREARLLDERMVRGMLADPSATRNLRRFVDWMALEIWLRSLESPGDTHGREAQAR